MLKPKRSRRVRELKDSDYDHEINLVDHDLSAVPSAEDQGGTQSPRSMSTDTTPPDIVREDTAARLLDSSEQQSLDSPSQGHVKGQGSREGLGTPPSEPGQEDRPSIAVQGGNTAPTPVDRAPSSPDPYAMPQRSRASSQAERENEIDILYENERGSFLCCGISLFSPRALGNLDPPHWTNRFHHKSRTDIETTQVPDPSWQWAWPEWRVSMTERTDDAGWEYSFAFANQFSWHQPRWWNSFVRRRVWTRKRERVVGIEEASSRDPHMMRTDYFAVKPASHRRPSRSISRSREHSRQMSAATSEAASVVRDVGGDVEAVDVDIADMEMLLEVLRASRIDREKIEAVENYLEHAEEGDLDRLGDHMHEIMSMFVYQISRRHLLAWLMQTHDTESQRRGRRAEALGKAVQCADEEVKRLAYWSDVKRMAEEGHSAGAVEGGRGWNRDEWEGVDRSGPVEPGGGKPP